MLNGHPFPARWTAAGLLAVGFLAVQAWAQQPGQKTFGSPEEACAALVEAARSQDPRALLDLLGAQGRRIAASGDPAEDANHRADFVRRYQEMHRLVQEPDGRTTLYIGAYNWPTPIPLAQKDRAWYFDTEAGLREILYRRIGRNESSAIRVCEELAEAQKEYYAARNHEYARSLFSAEGQRDGLYWKAAEGEPPSPIGPLVARAVAHGYPHSLEGGPAPFRGYFFRILGAQGRHAPGGARSYLIQGRMTGGFAFVAYPAQYRSSGVMTFIVGQDGVVRQKDLGRRTRALAGTLAAYDPDPTWAPAELGGSPRQAKP
jgi:hypothetical protein